LACDVLEDNPYPDRDASVVTIRSELVDPSRTFRLGVVAVALEHWVGDAPDVDLGYHAAKTAPSRSTKH
jgi:hypothetical protein